MEVDLARRIAAHPKYRELKAKRTSFGWWLTLAMMVVYYGFILLVAFNKEEANAARFEYPPSPTSAAPGEVGQLASELTLPPIQSDLPSSR